jgi:hypothetical protein
LHELAALVPPRAEYRLIHGELGPDHVLVGRSAEPVLIDIEGLMFWLWRTSREGNGGSEGGRP